MRLFFAVGAVASGHFARDVRAALWGLLASVALLQVVGTCAELAAPGAWVWAVVAGGILSGFVDWKPEGRIRYLLWLGRRLRWWVSEARAALGGTEHGAEFERVLLDLQLVRMRAGLQAAGQELHELEVRRALFGPIFHVELPLEANELALRLLHSLIRPLCRLRQIGQRPSRLLAL
ncbi:hypothetical protein V8E36_002155 [Tilletia maclaganii]